MSFTGSKFLVETDDVRVMVDCGLFQGERHWRRRNWEPLTVDPAKVDAVVITHAHLDHSGYLPLLVKNGFRGPAYCTPDTAELAAIILRDSAHIAEIDATHADARGYSKHEPALPLYDSSDAEKAIDLLTPVEYDAPTPIAEQIGLQLRSAGHILGSATQSSRSRGLGCWSAATSGARATRCCILRSRPGMRTRWWWSPPTATGCTTRRTTTCWPTRSPARSVGVVSC